MVHTRILVHVLAQILVLLLCCTFLLLTVYEHTLLVREHAVPVHPVLAVGDLDHLTLPGLVLPAPALPALPLGVEPPSVYTTNLF